MIDTYCFLNFPHNPTLFVNMLIVDKIIALAAILIFFINHMAHNFFDLQSSYLNLKYLFQKYLTDWRRKKSTHKAQHQIKTYLWRNESIV